MRELTLSIAILVWFLSSFAHADNSIDILIAISKAKDKKPTPAPVISKRVQLPAALQQTMYTWRVKRIARPAGVGNWDIEGVDNPSHAFAYQHLMSTHGHMIREITKHCDISAMSTRDIMSLHSLIHEGRSYGRWTVNGNIITFVFELP